MAARPRGGRGAQWWRRITRDSVLWGVGIYFAFHEIVLRSQQLPERPFTLAFIAACLGTPFVMRYEEARQARASAADAQAEGKVEP